MPGPPPPPASSAAAAASWASWKAERFCVARLNSTRDSTSSCGSGGSEEKVISGADTRPSTVTMAVTSREGVSRDEVDLRVEVADELQRALVEVDALAEDQHAAAAQVELADRLDVGGRALHASAVPPSSTSRPRPRTKIWFGALIRTSSPMPGPGARPCRARLADLGAVEGELHRRRGVDVGDLLERRLGVGAEALGHRDLGAAEVDAARRAGRRRRPAARAS